MEKQKTTVTLAGRAYTLVSTDSPEHVQRVAAYADRLLRETALATRLPAPQAAALTDLNLADELLKAQDENQRLRRRARTLEEALAAAGQAPAGEADR